MSCLIGNQWFWGTAGTPNFEHSLSIDVRSSLEAAVAVSIPQRPANLQSTSSPTCFGHQWSDSTNSGSHYHVGDPLPNFERIKWFMTLHNSFHHWAGDWGNSPAELGPHWYQFRYPLIIYSSSSFRAVLRFWISSSRWAFCLAPSDSEERHCLESSLKYSSAEVNLGLKHHHGRSSEAILCGPGPRTSASITSPILQRII